MPEEGKRVEIPEEANLVYVAIPETNIYEEVYATISINGVKFFAGQTYLVSPEIAQEITEIKGRYEKGLVRLMQRNPDKKTVREISKSLNFAGTEPMPRT